MGWEDRHLHCFEVGDERFGITEDFLYSWDYRVKDYLEVGGKMTYEYDFGACWRHEVVFEEIVPKTIEILKSKVPVCIDGARNCPLEDCGGVDGHNIIVGLLERGPEKTPEAYRQFMSIVRLTYDPEAFNPRKVRFTDANRRLKKVLSRMDI